MKIKKLSPVEWETERTPNDFHISFEDGRYVVDVFRSEAYCESGFDTPAAIIH